MLINIFIILNSILINKILINIFYFILVSYNYINTKKQVFLKNCIIINKLFKIYNIFNSCIKNLNLIYTIT